jgi:spore germination protein
MIQIVTVQPGDAVFEVAQRYGTTIDQIFLDNGLSASISLVVGQSLLVNTPGNVYFVQPGDFKVCIRATFIQIFPACWTFEH